MISKDVAIIAKERSLAAVRELSAMLLDIQGKCSDEDFEAIKRGVGLSLGRIQMDILEYINSQYPELDDLID